MNEFFLSMRGVSKRYTGVQALDSVDFDIRYGEVHCLAGENGSGKRFGRKFFELFRNIN